MGEPANFLVGGRRDFDPLAGAFSIAKNSIDFLGEEGGLDMVSH